MKPSEMTDDELRVAIAEELGWTIIPPVLNQAMIQIGIKPNDKMRAIVPLPNWSDDIAAAMGLLCKMVRDRKTFVGAIIHYRIKSYDVTLWKISADDHIRDVKTKHDNTPKGIARAICEAWLTARRTNG